jgi:hypothetical protein
LNPSAIIHPVSSRAVFHWRRKSLLRGNVAVLVSLAAAFWISDFPRSRATPLLAIPALIAIAGMFDTVRCMQPRWNLYHGGVVLCLYMDLMAICLILFFLFFPYLF